jgi:putative component of toxin-antitoxin plasmid stabilization module
MVRFRQPDQAQELLQAFAAAAEAGEHKQVAGCAAELRVVEGEEEEQYYKRVSDCCRTAHCHGMRHANAAAQQNVTHYP